MPVQKFSVSLPGGLLDDIDRLAEQDGESRSAVVREAAVAYVTARKAAAAQAERRTRVTSALEVFDEVASTWGPDERSATEYLAELRSETSPGQSGRSGDDR